MLEDKNMSLEVHLKAYGIEKTNILDSCNKYKKSHIKQQMVHKQLQNISEFHKAASKYSECGATKLQSCIGKDIEGYKVRIKKLKSDMENFEKNNPNNSFEELILDNGHEYIKRAEKCISTVNNSNYFSLVLRSMKKMEICLGDTSFNNLRNEDGLKVIDLKGCCYNMVETDGVYILSKLKRKELVLDWDKLIDYYCGSEELDKNSKRVITALLSYPYEFIKCWNRYRNNLKSWTVKEYCVKMQAAMVKDGESLI